MKHYLSSGMGVNSVALHLLMLKEGYDFEAVFVNHGGDWPETYAYLESFQNYLMDNGHKPVTVLKPVLKRKGGIYKSIIEHCKAKKIIPQQWPRWCTVDWKKDVVIKYVEKPCFMHIGIDSGESRRAKIANYKCIENRYLLIEHEINREGCKKLISDHGLPIPKKSGCFICPFQKRNQWKELRIKHPCLFNLAVDLEKNSNRVFHSGGNKNLLSVIDDSQNPLFETDEYPPCQCGL